VDAPVTTASLRALSSIADLLHARLEHHLDPAILLVAERAGR
jgi:hypothetical protein